MKKTKKLEDLKLEEALERLELIAREMENDTIDLEGSVARYKEARAIYTHCVSQLGEAQREVEILMADGSSTTLDQTEVAEEDRV
jgi:exodeoxyribonuclease VII small subunit